ncbi:hypothetical protein EDD11_006481 [Mortierella claussenii]|nr:hypothetical protein EDD11_006481 [Mortierella claussenii]
MSDESYVLVGTALPPITKSDAFGETTKSRSTRDQEASRHVRDEQGRRRFHGAFTGGFSAGYYNTVGSKEGWAPSEFVSSRNKRSEAKKALPEDFMDEEDKQMLSDTKQLVATDDFDTLGSSQRDLGRKRAAAMDMQSSRGILGVLPDALIDDLIVPSTEQVGIRLLKRMGWKPGQGIGPRVSRRQQKPGDKALSDADDIPANITFAPIDSAVVVFVNKANRQGLGFDPYKNAPEFDRSLHRQGESKYLMAQSGHTKSTFGFGSFDDDDEDDDIYGSGSANMRSFAAEAGVDQRLGNEQSDSRKREESWHESDSSTPLLCSDGRPPLTDFILSVTPVKSVKWYSAPSVPRDYVPHHTFLDDIKPAAQINRRDQNKLTADDRALVLGETPIDAPRRSVFEYMSAENKNRIDNILGFVMDTDGEKRARKDYWEVPKIDKAAAQAALQGFIPFGDNVQKQTRYKQYLNIQAGAVDEIIELVPGFSAEDMTKELSEFVQAARIFKPLSSSMANRFTTASKTIEFTQPTAGLRTAEDVRASEKSMPIEPVVEKMEIPKSQAAKAAAMGMFGPLTRTVVDLYPSKLLCKRFNVPNPHPNHKDLGPETAKDLLDKDTMDKMMMNRVPGGGIMTVDAIDAVDAVLGSPSVNTASVVSNELQVDEDKSQEVHEEILERPSMDIFKAIFDDSDSDADSDVDDSEEVKPGSGTEAAQEEIAFMDKGMPENREERQVEQQGPFRPIFTKKTDRHGTSSTAISSRVQSRVSKPGLPYSFDDDDEEDEHDMGPKLAISKPSPVKISSTGIAKRAAERREDNASDKAYTPIAPSYSARRRSPTPDVRPESPALSTAPLSGSLSTDITSRQASSPSFISRQDESQTSKRRRSSPPRQSSSHKEYSASSRRISSPSSSQRSEERYSGSSSRPRSTSRTRRKESRHHDGSDTDSQNDTDKDGRAKKRVKEPSSSSSSRSKSRRHREHKSRARSRSRSKSPSSRTQRKSRDKDRSGEREKDKKRSRTDKHRSSHRARRDEDNEELDMEGLWVEKKVDIVSPTPARAPVEPSLPPPPPVRRVRASDFF